MSEDTNEDTDGDSAAAAATEEQPGEEEDVRPDIKEDERAEMDLSGFAEDVEDSVGDSIDTEGGEDADTESAADGEGEDTPDTTDDDSDDTAATQDGETWGDMYVEVLAVVLTEAVDELAEDDDDRMSAEEVAALATQPPVNLPKQVDRLAAEMGGAEDLPPGQAVVISTGLLAVVVLTKETDLMGDLLGEVMDR